MWCYLHVKVGLAGSRSVEKTHFCTDAAVRWAELLLLVYSADVLTQVTSAAHDAVHAY
jgi:hypothetical protein